jgi:hypothetical protein
MPDYAIEIAALLGGAPAAGKAALRALHRAGIR